MRRFLSTCFATLTLLAVAQLAQAQVFYTQNFSGGGIPSGWATTDGSGQNAFWEYCAGPSSACVDMYNQPLYASTSVANGFMVMDSDAAGDLPSNHISRLTSSVIDCSGRAQIFATFETYIGVFEVPTDGKALFQVSTDNATWTTYNFIPGLDVTNRFSDNPYVAMIDISAVAANQATVYLRWEWTGRFEYWWMLDDVNLTTTDPTPPNNLSLSGFFYPVSSYSTPVSQIKTDTFGFSGLVTNIGSAAQTNVKLKAEVVNSANAVIFTTSETIPLVEVGEVDVPIVLPNQFVPNLAEGLYSIRYTVSADATDTAPANNVAGDDFLVSDFVFAKEEEPTGGLRPGTVIDYSVANLYQMSSASLENYKALGFEISAAVNAGDPPLGQAAVTAYLLRVNDDILPDFSNFDDAAFLSPSLELKGLTSFEFPDDAVSYTPYAIELIDDNEGSGIALDKGARYFATITYADASNLVFQANSDATTHTFVSSLVYTDQWYTGGFGEDYNAYIRMIIELSTATDDIPLPESALTLFPNPVKDVLNLEVSFEQATNATITIADINGRVIKIDNRDGLTNEVLTYQLPQLAAGTYLARIATEAGTKTKKFVVVK